MNALTLSQQQRADALAQRAEDQRAKARAEAEAATLQRTAFARNIRIWDTNPMDSSGVNEWQWDIRNANARPALVFLRWDGGNGMRFFEFDVRPCSEGVLAIPGIPGEGSGGATFFLTTEIFSDEFWTLDGKAYAEEEFWRTEFGNYEGHLEPTNVKEGITPCT
ncbi:hypothetical protein ABZ912_05230 [Nonomuraea angiospora]|uniref:hypothetical protein n=1 Tax=Nonomuraea angiospora TaxID=46172 RepID=UPI00340C7252